MIRPRHFLAYGCLFVFAFCVTVLMLNTVALPAPPPGADPNSEIAAWYHSLTVPDGAPSAGGLCCSLSDCRPVDYRQDSEGYEVLIGHQFKDIDTPFWVRVPPEVVILHKENPEGRPVACWYMNKLRCFVPPTEA